MSFSQGNIVFTRKETAAAPAGVLTLDNGLTLTGTNGQLGGPLIKDTVIYLSGFKFQMLGIGTGEIDLSGGVSTINLKNNLILNTNGNIINEITQNFATIGWTDLFNNFNLAMGNKELAFSGPGGGYLDIDANLHLYQIGDLGELTNKNKLIINDTTQIATLGRTDKAFLKIDNAANAINFGNSTLFQKFNLAAQMLSIFNGPGEIYRYSGNGVQTLNNASTGLGVPMKFDSLVAGAAILDGANYLHVSINGVVKKIALII